MLNMLNPNSNIRFHKCMPKEVHQIYDTLKLMEQQEDTKKVEAEAKKEEQSNSTNADNQANTSKKDQLLDISA
ncbi:hypothetical protein GIE48_08695 [Campylobacter coli]|uniref:Uncharacterized protein n=1 Tax=Campylobacter jejuni TaxID=197 RepID=A0A610PNL5_CAMJU|nr:hypothetical protein [Campylobacter jejuni]EAC1801555.1 hypothetical protein [Campylobacter coli]EGF7486078.1 hypothetical protein [Salmonella enterica subsp. enterica serovar Montevideo]EHF6446901.1 hypothetical protein [Salmonella enterica subsp. enterica serovar Derby]EIB41849.1 hypothetical protein cje14_05338 [Campylobacter jejuni subsp. jejuni 53161]APA51641.1 hypothetical protein BLD34_09375 [Campylobacter jejuni]